jgi:hypothetical protein
VELATSLNATMQAAAKAAGVGFVTDLNTFKGHELCTAKSWVDSLTLFKTSDPDGRGHPLLAGQMAIATTVATFMKKHKLN